jgi:ribose/xylose/arabinose/galactoside ABC-type transport system permease subunit
VNAREVESAAAEVERSLQRTFRSLGAAVVLALIALGVTPLSSTFAIALAVGAVLELGSSSAFWLCRRERIERLALEPSAYTIPAVARFGARVAGVRGALTARRSSRRSRPSWPHRRFGSSRRRPWLAGAC